jgi:hypothetical protein
VGRAARPETRSLPLHPDIPTRSSWPNLIERFFAELSPRHLKRLAVTRIDEPVVAITAYVEHRNTAPRPFIETCLL